MSRHHPAADTIEDVADLLSWGESPAHITRRLDMTPAAIAQALYRNGETQPARGFWAEQRRARRTRPTPAHRRDPIAIFITDAGPLELTQCLCCGRMFDAVRFAMHVRPAGGEA